MKTLTIALSALLMVMVLSANAQGPAHKRKTKKKTSTTAATRTSATAPASIKSAPAPADESYQNAVGLKVLYGVAVTGKHFFTPAGAVEAVINFRSYGGIGNEFNLSALYEYHQKINGVPGLRWYLGGGGYIGHYSYDLDYDDIYGTSTSYGITAVAGLEYKFSNVPIAISADWQPVFFLNRYTGLAADNGGVGVKYTF